MVLPLDVCRAPFRAYIPSFQPAQHRRSSLSGINPGKIYSNHGSLFSNHDTLARVHLHHECIYTTLLNHFTGDLKNNALQEIHSMGVVQVSHTAQCFLQQGVKLLPWAVLQDA